MKNKIMETEQSEFWVVQSDIRKKADRLKENVLGKLEREVVTEGNRGWSASILVFFGLLFIFTLPAAGGTLFELKPVIPNVYLAVATSQTIVNCNSAVIVLEDGVLVVDSQSTPAAARALIEEIKKVTPKPIRWVVNTHMHFDHVQGNAAYVGKWPAGAGIISSEVTRANIELIGRTRMAAERTSLPRRIAELRSSMTNAPPERRTALEAEIAGTEAYLAEIRATDLLLPTLTFDRSMTIRRGSTVVQLLWLGRGHTDGDVVVYLPNEKVVCTGDLVHGRAPYMGDSYPCDWIETLGKLAGLDFDYVLSGHGDILRGKQQIRLWQEFLRDLLALTTKAVGDGLTLAQTLERVSPDLKSRFEKQFPSGTLRDLTMSISKAWRLIAFQSGQ